MFEVECPSCRAGYKVDERRIPPTGLKMRCPQCGESFQVSAGGPSEPPVLGAALGLSGGQDKEAQGRPSKKTMLGLAPAQDSEQPAARAPSGGRQESDGFELASLDDSPPGDEDSDLEAELPVPSARGAWQPPGAFESAKKGGEASQSSKVAGEIDLFLDEGEKEEDPGLPSPATEADLPAPAGAGVEFDLPSPAAEFPDLPSPRERRPGSSKEKLAPGMSADLPEVSEAELPSASADLPAQSEAGLPAPGEAGLPSPGGELPTLTGELPTLGLDSAQSGLPSLSPDTPSFEQEFDPGSPVESGDDGAFILSQAPQARTEHRSEPAEEVESLDPIEDSSAAAGVEPASSEPAAYGEVDLGGGAEDDVGAEFDAFPTESASEQETSSYGDVSLDDGGVGLSGSDVSLDDDLQRGPAPAGPSAAASAQVELPRADRGAPPVKTPRSGLSKGVKVTIFAALILTVVGGALGAVFPEVGPYGAYFIMDTINADAHRAALQRDIERAQTELDRDTSASVARAFQIVDRGRQQAPRFEPRAAYAAYLGFLGRVRFGTESSKGAAAQGLIQSLQDEEASEVEFLRLARLAAAVAAGSPDEAADRALIDLGVDYAALVGEAALMTAEGELAMTAFQAVLAEGPSARGHFGVARAQQLLEQDEFLSSAQRVLELNPKHPGAKLLLAEHALKADSQEERVIELLLPLSKGSDGASVAEQAKALVLLGDLHLTRGRFKKAEAAFSQALSLEAGNPKAQRGLADALFESGRFSEAQTRYEAALEANPDSLSAGLGLVRSRIRLEELESAITLLDQLRQKHPQATAIEYWTGRVQEQLGHRSEARQAYEKAISLDESGPALVKSYISLTRILGKDGKTEAAENILSKAKARFPEDPLVYQALAELSSSRGSFEKAVEQYEQALELDPGNLALHFAKAVALRKARRFEEAERQLDHVEKMAQDYPGLALERGNLLEASGRSEAALAAYEKALAEAPDSLDMMLRVGCARASAGQGEPAVELLNQVYEERPNSAEVNFCLGLGYLHGDSSLEQAKRHLKRAVGFDASRASYHLYVGWVAIELGDYPLASVSLEKALELDQTLADAYWKRGELRVKQGAVDDAVSDLTKALELSPSRVEAHAQLALAYLQNGKEPLALEQFRQATQQNEVDPYFHYRYGELLLNNRRPEEARRQLELALAGVEESDQKPPWIYEAHRLLAMALGRQKAALPHWKMFADNAPQNSPYLAEALREMEAILDKSGH